jgi:hypothetical protein
LEFFFSFVLRCIRFRIFERSSETTAFLRRSLERFVEISLLSLDSSDDERSIWIRLDDSDGCFCEVEDASLRVPEVYNIKKQVF